MYLYLSYCCYLPNAAYIGLQISLQQTFRDCLHHIHVKEPYKNTCNHNPYEQKINSQEEESNTFIIHIQVLSSQLRKHLQQRLTTKKHTFLFVTILRWAHYFFCNCLRFISENLVWWCSIVHKQAHVSCSSN